MDDRCKNARFSLSVLITFLLMAFTSCAQLSTTHSVSRFDIPETFGHAGDGDVGGGVAGGNKLTLAANPLATPPVFDPSIHYDQALDPVAVRLGLLKKMDLGFYLGTNSLPAFRLKVQLMGDSLRESKAGNRSLAVTGGLGGGLWGLGDRVYTPNSVYYDGYEWFFDLAAIFGYRVSEDLLLYGGPFLTCVFYSGSVSTEQGTNSAPVDYGYPTTVDYIQEGLNFGARYTWKSAFVMGEIAWGRGAVGAVEYSAPYLGMQVGFHWDTIRGRHAKK